MSRIACLSCSILLLACGSDGASKKSTTALAPSAAETHPWADVDGRLQALTIFRASSDAPLSIMTLGNAPQVWSSDGMAQDSSWLAGLEDLKSVDVQGEKLWLASDRVLREVHAKTFKPGLNIELPEGTKISAIEVGYQSTVFVADADAGRLIAASPTGSETLIEGSELGHPRALLLNGGSLIIASDKKLLSFNIKSRESKVMSEELGEVVALAHDHLGYFISLSASGEIRQVKGDGSSRLLLTLPSPASSIAFDLPERTLYVAEADTQSVSAHDYLELTGEDKKVWSKRDARLMRSYQKNGMTVAGGEYWPSHGVTNVSYPDDILWGFYPSPDQVIEGSASKVAPPAAAIACAEKSYRALQEFVDSNPEKFHRAAEISKSSKQFYLWVNDYSDTAIEFPHKTRPSKFWYWKRDPAVTGRVPGFWKWETTLMQDGGCHTPKAEQIDAYLDEVLAGV